jgi:anaerobic selenocysteine-containing dehydrogenase
MTAPLPKDARHVPAVCPLDCPDACSLDVVVAGDRVLQVGGSRVNPVTEGYICAKVRRYPELVHGQSRVLYPRVRTGPKGEGRFRRASWDEALSLVTERLLDVRSRYGGEAILPLSYGGSNGYISHDSADARFFSRLGASQLDRTVCAAPSGAAAAGLYGKMPGVAMQDYALAKLIVLWGVNPSASGIHLVPYVQRAVEKGARLVVVDPRRTKLAEGADLHLAVQPGTDLPVALSLIRFFFETGRADRDFLARHATGAEELARRAAPWTFERAAAEARVSGAELERFAQMYAEASPAVVRCGWGLERNRNGGSAVAAVLALPAVAGKFGLRGGGYTMSNSKAFRLDVQKAARVEPQSTRVVNMNRIGEALLAREKPVAFLFVYNCNPVMTLPAQEKVRRSLLREDLFTVVFDPVMTDTALYADVVLPAATFLEREELSRGYGALVLQRNLPAIPPVGESRPNHEVFAELSRRAGVKREGDPESASELTEAILETGSAPEALRSALARDGVAYPDGKPASVPFVDHLPWTSDGKIHLVPEELDRESGAGLYSYIPDPAPGALALVSPATDRTISTSLGELHPGQVPAELHPEDAAARGISDGDRIRIWNSFGETRCLARLNRDVKPGVAVLSKGLWSHNTLSGSTANAVAPDTLTDVGGGACFNDARVEVERLP